MLIFNSVPVSYRTECTFSHLTTRRCCQPCLATNVPDVIHAACLPLPPRPRPGEQVPAGAQGARLGPGEPWRRKTGPPLLPLRPGMRPLASHLTPAWVRRRTSPALAYRESVFTGPGLRFAMSGAALGPGPRPSVGSPAPGLKSRPRWRDPRRAQSGKQTGVRLRGCSPDAPVPATATPPVRPCAGDCARPRVPGAVWAASLGGPEVAAGAALSPLSRRSVV